MLLVLRNPKCANKRNFTPFECLLISLLTQKNDGGHVVALAYKGRISAEAMLPTPYFHYHTITAVTSPFRDEAYTPQLHLDTSICNPNQGIMPLRQLIISGSSLGTNSRLSLPNRKRTDALLVSKVRYNVQCVSVELISWKVGAVPNTQTGCKAYRLEVFEFQYIRLVFLNSHVQYTLFTLNFNG